MVIYIGAPDYSERIGAVVESALGEEVKSVKDSYEQAHRTFTVSTTGGDVVVRFCHKGKNEERFRSAPAALSLVSSVPTPDLIRFDGTKSVVPEQFMITSYEEGQVLEMHGTPDFRYIPEHRRKSLSKDVGRKLGVLHRENKMESFGRLTYNDGEAAVDSRDSWAELYLEILKEEQLAQMSKPFQDLVPTLETWLENHISFLDTRCSPCIVHQDLKPDNMIVGDRDVNSIVDWERAISGHPELDLFTTDSRLFSRLTDSAARKYRPYMYRGYFDERDLQTGWKTRREFYLLLKTVEAMWTFSGWSDNLDNAVAVEKHLRRTLDNEMDHVETLM
nr:MAG: putative aminoglycoside phosphotransferase [Candidatus Nanosalinarum sp. J07AB56]